MKAETLVGGGHKRKELVNEWKKKEAEDHINSEWHEAQEYLSRGHPDSALANLSDIEKSAAEAGINLPREFSEFRTKAGLRALRTQVQKLRNELKTGEGDEYELRRLKDYALTADVTLPGALEKVEECVTVGKIEEAYATLNLVFPEIKNKYECIKGAIEANPNATAMEFGQALHVAPKKETYDLNALQEFMESLIPFGLEPDSQKDFIDHGSYWMLGELTFSNVEEGSEVKVRVYPGEAVAKRHADRAYADNGFHPYIDVNVKKGLFDCSMSEAVA